MYPLHNMPKNGTAATATTLTQNSLIPVICLQMDNKFQVTTHVHSCRH